MEIEKLILNEADAVGPVSDEYQQVLNELAEEEVKSNTQNADEKQPQDKKSDDEKIDMDEDETLEDKNEPVKYKWTERYKEVINLHNQQKTNEFWKEYFNDTKLWGDGVYGKNDMYFWIEFLTQDCKSYYNLDNNEYIPFFVERSQDVGKAWSEEIINTLFDRYRGQFKSKLNKESVVKSILKNKDILNAPSNYLSDIVFHLIMDQVFTESTISKLGDQVVNLLGGKGNLLSIENKYKLMILLLDDYIDLTKENIATKIEILNKYSKKALPTKLSQIRFRSYGDVDRLVGEIFSVERKKQPFGFSDFIEALKKNNCSDDIKQKLLPTDDTNKSVLLTLFKLWFMINGSKKYRSFNKEKTVDINTVPNWEQLTQVFGEIMQNFKTPAEINKLINSIKEYKTQ